NVDVHTIIREITGHFSAMSYLPVDLQFAPENIAVKGNAQRLKVALENIISNALEASGVEKTVRIRSEFHPRDASLRIDVIDSGEGIPVEQIDKIFDIFYSTRGKSRGLGLAITREIIKRHGGHIDVQSSAGNGTRMSIILPATVNVQEVADEPRIDR
ncbi:MAG: ATP-binding protein, partial [Calditrichaeota bacterium]|nr:ATP-binding protein [Calditrichota bacterium]